VLLRVRCQRIRSVHGRDRIVTVSLEGRNGNFSNILLVVYNQDHFAVSGRHFVRTIRDDDIILGFESGEVDPKSATF